VHIVIIGLGGVGSILVGALCRYNNYTNDKDCSMLLVDGDHYEPKNFERQEFTQMGNKAESKAFELEMKFNKIKFDTYENYINESNISEVMKENDIIFVCVDNHKSRMVVNNYCKQLKNVTLISGGNELTDGNAQIYVRRGGIDLTPDLCAYHPEIANPNDKLPDEMSCEELSQSEPQLYFTNLGVATSMCWAFYNAVVKGQHERSEVYFDITKMTMDAKVRSIKSKET
jgi:molybdopterin/thiamine biosynthesis adenylyltransferase